ncbi:hypothetical protein [Micromonospora purpureochromogenes]|uniref:Uncharacterized protein n=1 Tax=Micromonospora purpureochromogenes TaxID=47872 RepID=A0ABX2RKT4_9ACTN|nr:hypothetical protein [Micromonospora purpureochromogenes]NYF55779.1 hypothetical protein [Micromonospora purpureochromogenes]
MSFDLVVLAMAPNASLAEARAMLDHCTSGHHRDGELDEHIVAFYEELRARYPDEPPLPPDSPWMSTPLAVGIDHVSMNITWSGHGTEAVEAVLELTQRHGLVLYDPQGDEFVGLRAVGS